MPISRINPSVAVASRDGVSPPKTEAVSGGADSQRVSFEWRTTMIAGLQVGYGVSGELTSLAPTVVFLHGWALTNSTYRAGLERLAAAGFRVIAPALPGHGASAPLPDHSELGDYAEWVDRFLGAVDTGGPVVLVGHSFGGAVAIRLAHDHPKRVRALVLIDSIGGSAWRKHGSIIETMKARPLWDWGLHFPADIFPARQMRRVLPVIVHDAVINALRNPRAVWQAASLARFADLTTELEDLKARELPVVVVWGARDRIVGRMSIDSLIAAVGAKEVHTVEGGHSWLLADPNSFGEIITNVVTVAEQMRSLETQS